MESGFDGNEACMHFTRGLKVEGSVKIEGGSLEMGLGLENGHWVFEKKEEEEEDFRTKFAASITELCLLESRKQRDEKRGLAGEEEEGYSRSAENGGRQMDFVCAEEREETEGGEGGGPWNK